MRRRCAVLGSSYSEKFALKSGGTWLLKYRHHAE